MGMIANYQETTNQELEARTDPTDIVEAVEALQEREDLDLCDIDKMWDALHFLLTGKSASEPVEDDPISEAIVGQFVISGEDMEEFVAGTQAERVKTIADALQRIDFETYAKTFDMRLFAQHDIYPSIWSYDEEAALILDDLRGCFESLKQFYVRMAAKDAAVFVSIY